MTLLIILIILILLFHLPKRLKSSSYFIKSRHSKSSFNRNQNLDNSDSSPSNILISPPILNSSTSTLVDLESLTSNNDSNINKVGSKVGRGFRWNPISSSSSRRKQSFSTSVSLSSTSGIELLSRNSFNNQNDLDQSELNIRERDISLPPRFSSLSIYSQVQSESTASNLPPSLNTPLYSSNNIDIEVLSTSEGYQNTKENEEGRDYSRTSSESFENIDLSSPVLSQSTFSYLEEVPPFPIGLIEEALLSYVPPTTTTSSSLSFSTDTSSRTSTESSKFGFPPLPPTPPITPPKLLSSNSNSNSNSNESSPESMNEIETLSEVERIENNFPEIQINGKVLIQSSSNRNSFSSIFCIDEKKDRRDDEIILVPMFKPEEVFDDHVGVII